MKNLVILGNGFDLAHGLKTSYKDFLDHLFCKELDFFIEHHQGEYTIKPIPHITLFNFYLLRNDLKVFFDKLSLFKNIDSIEDFNTKVKTDAYKATFYGSRGIFTSSKVLEFKATQNRLSKCLLKSIKTNWVDIEQSYFEATLDSDESEIIEVNKLLDYVKTELKSYLSNNITTASKIAGITRIFSTIKQSNHLIVNFNYTNTPTYLYSCPLENYCWIHGNLESNLDEFIFGYGDELSSHYNDLENKNNKEYIKNMKSIKYLFNDKYKKISNFINEKEFNVIVLGHSLGLSDRVLLNTIFTHDNCTKIKLYHYKDIRGFEELACNISRHFPNDIENRKKLKDRVVPFSPANRHPQHDD